MTGVYERGAVTRAPTHPGAILREALDTACLLDYYAPTMTEQIRQYESAFITVHLSAQG